MKKSLLVILIGLTTSLSYAQTTNEISSLKPADESPAVFSSQKDLREHAPMKISKIKSMIESTKDERQLKVLREDLWRFENAIVVEPRK